MKTDKNKISRLKLFMKISGLFFVIAGLITGLLLVIFSISGPVILLVFLGLITLGLLLLVLSGEWLAVLKNLP